MQDDTELSTSAHGELNPKQPKHALCHSCNEVKPIKDFKTMSTYAQARAWGYKRAIQITSKNCKACRRPRKKLKDLTIKELHTKIATGDIKGGAVAEVLKARRIADGKRRMREGVSKRWAQVRFEYWHGLYDDTILEYKRIRSSLYAVPTNHNPEKQALKDFYKQYLATISKVRGIFMLHQKKGEPIPKKRKGKQADKQSITWHDFVEPQQLRDLHGLWDCIPIEHKLRLNLPELLALPIPLDNTERETHE